MKNLFIDAGTRAEIDRTVDRVHRDLKPVNEKIVLPEMRELLKLDLAYYTANDPSLFDEVVHKLRLGARQVLKIPMRLREVVDKFGLSALLLPARKRILLDQDMPDLKKRWACSRLSCRRADGVPELRRMAYGPCLAPQRSGRTCQKSYRL